LQAIIWRPGNAAIREVQRQKRKLENVALSAIGPTIFSGGLDMYLAWIALILGAQLLAPVAHGQMPPGGELEGAIAKEQADGDLKEAIDAYRRIAANVAAPRDVRARALLQLARCYEKLGQQAQKVYEQVMRDFADEPAATQARARLAASGMGQVASLKELRPERLTENTPELAIQMAAISPDGKSIAYSDPLGVHVRSVVTGATRLLPGTSGNKLVQWMPNSKSFQTQVQDHAGQPATTMLVSLGSGEPSPMPDSDLSLSSPDRTHRAMVSVDQRLLSVSDANGGNTREVWRALGKGTLDQFQWRPDSKKIVILSSAKVDGPTQNPAALELADITGGKKELLIATEKKLPISSIVWPNQNRMIVTIDEDIGINIYNSNLWEIRLNSIGAVIPGGLRRLTAWTDLPIRSGSLSTDGKRLVFIRSVQQRDVYVAPLEEGGARMGTPRRLTLDLGDDYPTGWTRDSKTVLLTSSRNGPQAIFRQDLENQTAGQMVVMPGDQLLARVTPDGNSVLFWAYDRTKRTMQMMRLPIGGGTPEPLPNLRKFGGFKCSRAGLCEVVQKDGAEYLIFELDPVKGKVREIYRDSQERLDVSPDGKVIAAPSGNGSETKIVLRSFSTGAIIREIPIRGVTKFTSFDYDASGKGFFVGDRSLTEIRELYIDLSGNVSVLYRQPGSIPGIWGIPSPDGKYLALMMFTDDANVYMVEGPF